MLAEELTVLDGDSPLWNAARPLLDAALLLEQNDEHFSWHGWNKAQIEQFLASLPSRCSLIAAVWDTLAQDEEHGIPEERELLTLGILCEVVAGEIQSLRTFNALTASGLKPIEQLEPGPEDAYAVLRIAKLDVAPVAWALFTDRATWNEWVFTDNTGNEDAEEAHIVDKGVLLATFARQGRCVLLGTQTSHHHF